MDAERQLLRHTLATLAYRGAKALRDAPPEFAAFRAAETSRSPVEIVAHISDLLDWGLSIAEGRQTWEPKPPGEWQAAVDRFFSSLAAFDDFLDSDQALRESTGKLFQGPIADSLQHVGQLTMLRRLSGAPIRGENYHKAAIVVGTVGPDQDAPKREFD